MTTTNVITLRAKAFAGESSRLHQCIVDPSGTVRVWDSVAGHYTACHSLPLSAVKRAHKLAGWRPTPCPPNKWRVVETCGPQ